MSDSDQDDDFEAYLKRRVPIDKGMKSLDRLEPPAELDRIVIGKARKAIQGGAPLNPYRAPKWALPVGLAATILLSFALLLDLGVRAKRNDASLQAALRSEAPAEARGEAVSPAQPSAAAPAVTRPAATEELSSDNARSRLARAEKAAKRARPEPETADTKTVQEEVVVGAQRASAGDAAYVAAAPIPAVPPDTAAMSSPPSTSVPMPALAPAPPASQSASNTAKPDTLEPAAWLAKIDQLRGSGQTAEVASELKRFREAYPDYPVPKDKR
jgi:hypothetical protein